MKKSLTTILILLLFIGGNWGLKKYLTFNPSVAKSEKIKVAMGFIPNIQFTPFYVAYEKGFYQEKGLDITFDYAQATDILKILGKGEISLAIASGDEVLLAASNEIPLSYVATLYQKFPVSICSLAEKNINTISELKNKKIGYPFFGSSYIGFRALLESSGVKEEELFLEQIGYTQAAYLVENKGDAAVVFSLNEPIQLREKGYDLNCLDVSDYVNLVSAGVVTNQKMTQENPKLIEKFVKATVLGMDYTLDHFEESFEIGAKYANLSEQNKEVQKKVLEKAIEFWQSEGTEEFGLGYVNEENWEETQDFLDKANLIEEKIDLKTLITNQFVFDRK